MEKEIRVQGRDLTPNDIQSINDLIQNNPTLSRRQLSIKLCKLWNWCNAKGLLKDMASRSLMLKLDQLNLIQLPPRRRVPSNRMLQKKVAFVEHDTTPLECSLKEVTPLKVINVHTDKQYDALYSYLMNRYHYLGYKGSVGENMKYVILDRFDRVLGLVLFGSAAWSSEKRDRFIGWSARKKETNLQFITNNTRFLILPWVTIKNLASHILSRINKKVVEDWEERYGHPVYLLETFVDQGRFKGTCYQAANWIKVGETKGRSRNDRYTQLKVPIKEIYIYPLARHGLKRLIGETTDGTGYDF